MNQEVNFLHNLPHAPRYLPSLWIGFAALSLLIILTSISSALEGYELYLTERLEDARSMRFKEETAYKKLAQAYPLLATDMPLVERVAALETKLQKKREQFKKLTHATLRRPFSDYLKGLAVAVPQGIWLFEIDIDQNENNISLGGYGMQPVDVSLLLKNLKKTSAFKDTEFDLFYVKKITNKNYIQFEVANKKLITKDESKEGAL